MRIVIAGGGVAGLASALALRRDDREIVVFERDAPPSGSPDEVFASWRHPGVPQPRHSHGLVGRLRKMLLTRYPELYAELLADGARERRFDQGLPPALQNGYRPCAGDEEMTALLCRRTTLEATLRRYVSALPGVAIESGVRVAGLELRTSGEHVAVAALSLVRGDAPSAVDGDIFVDATGAQSILIRSLRDQGVHVHEEGSAAGITYYTRWYRRSEGVDEPEVQREPRFGDLGFLRFGIFPAEERMFSVTMVVPDSDTSLASLRETAVFDRACAILPGPRAWTSSAAAEPMSEVLAMGGQRNLYRALDGMRPRVHGYFAVGDAAIRTNPVYARGCTMAFVHAHLLADAIDSADMAAAARRFAAATRRELRPTYRASVIRDAAYARAVAASGNPGAGSRLARTFGKAVELAMERDLRVRRAFRLEFHMLAPPGSAFRSPSILASIARVWLAARAAPPALSRDEFRREVIAHA